MAYITINGKMIKVNKTLKMDPNQESFNAAVQLGAKLGVPVKFTFKHCEPITIEADTDTYYKASYKDNFGAYNFEIHKTDKGYTVISDGNVCSKDNPDREHIIWNYENQVAARMPKVLA